MWQTAGAAAVHRVPLYALLLLWLVSQLVNTRVRLRGQTISVGLTSWSLVVTMVFASRTHLVPYVVGIEVVLGVLRRAQAVKIAFNACNIAVACAIGGIGFEALTSPLSLGRPASWLSITVAVFAVEVVSAATTFTVLAIQGALDLHRIGTFLMPLLILGPVNAVFAIITVDSVWTVRWALILVASIPGGAFLAHRSYVALSARYNNLEVLYRFTEHLAGLSEERDVVTAVLAGLREAFFCGVAQLVTLGEGAGACYQQVGDGPLTVVDLEASGALRTTLAGIEDVQVVTASRARRGGQTLLHGSNRVLVGRMPEDGGLPRWLLVGDRHDGLPFEKADRSFMVALAAQSAVALRGTRLLDELRSEAANREHDALHDPLTHLGNRTLFTRRTQTALTRRGPGTKVGVMLLDLDGFKEINDTLGHPVGDVVLKEVADRLQTVVRAVGVPTRLGGDEFAVLVSAASSSADIERLAASIAKAVAAPMDVGGFALTVQASIGIAMSPDHGTDTATLLKRADVAMYSAKGSSNLPVIYDQADDHNTTRRLTLATELRAAMAAEAFDLHFQPKIAMDTLQLRGFEALLRWNHPGMGSVSPAEFIPVAEQAGLIDQLTWWVLDRSLQEQRRWAANGFDLEVAVNFSAKSLLDANLPRRLAERLQLTGVPPDRLTIEVTETSVMADTKRSATILEHVAATGIKLAIDDFGTGYSSLSRLRELPVDEIKVDRSFVTTMLDSPDNHAIVAGTVHLALSMGRTVVAEGVEDLMTWDALRDMGCQAAQGFVMSPPMAADEVMAWLALTLDGAVPVPRGAAVVPPGRPGAKVRLPAR